MTDGTGSGTTEQDYIRQIERLQAKLREGAKEYQTVSDQLDYVQARVEKLEGGISKALEFSSLPDTPHLKLIIKQLRALAATEQGEDND